MDVQDVEKYLTSELKRLGFHVMGYHSMSTDSVYLKIDYGVAHAIRVSDHEGKRVLGYRYNVLTDTDKKHPYRVKCDSHDRFYYPPNKQGLDMLIGMICGIRTRKISKYGEENYNRYMAEAYEANKDNRGFWSRASVL